MTMATNHSQDGARLLDRVWLRNVAYVVALAAFVFLIPIAWAQLGTAEPAPDFELRSIDGETVDLASLEGEPHILYFWAPWCGVCNMNSATINRVAQTGQLTSIVVDYDTPRALRKHMEEHGIAYPTLMAESTDIEPFEVDAFPTYWILNSDGTVSSTVSGYTTEMGLRARLLLAD